MGIFRTWGKHKYKVCDKLFPALGISLEEDGPTYAMGTYPDGCIEMDDSRDVPYRLKFGATGRLFVQYARDNFNSLIDENNDVFLYDIEFEASGCHMDRREIVRTDPKLKVTLGERGMHEVILEINKHGYTYMGVPCYYVGDDAKLYNMIISLIEDYTQVSIEIFTNGAYSYVDETDEYR